MAITHNALYLAIYDDVCSTLSLDQKIAALFPGATIPIYPDDCTSTRAAVSLLRSVFSKYLTLKTSQADELALEKFLYSDKLCENWTLDLKDLRDELLFNNLRVVIEEFFQPISFCNLEYLFTKGRLGSGMNRLSGDSTLYSKLYSSPLTASSQGIFELYQRCVGSIDRLRSAEFIRTLHFGKEPRICNSRLSFVPKKNDISRTICTEPTLNTYFQLGLAEVISRRLSDFGITLDRQPDINRVLCRIGSVRNSYATIDLESASDSMSTKLLDELMPKEFLGLLKFFRCGFTSLPDGSEHKLNMISSMGNGYTFPLQTAFFLCVVLAVFRMYGITPIQNVTTASRVYPGNFGVFGDDIIVPSECYGAVCRLLTICGFRVNTTKSFNEGPFRESCGVDFHKGTDIRPVYLKRDLKSERSRYSAYNALMLWAAKHNIPLIRACRLLARSVQRLFVPRSEDPESGLFVPSAQLSRSYMVRSGGFRYKRLRVQPRRFSIYRFELSQQGPRYNRSCYWNPDGMFLFGLFGGIRNGQFIIPRRDSDPVRIEDALSPNWDGIPQGPDLLDRAGWNRWECDSLRVLAAL